MMALSLPSTGSRTFSRKLVFDIWYQLRQGIPSTKVLWWESYSRIARDAAGASKSFGRKATLELHEM